MSITLGDAVLWIRGKQDQLPGDLNKAETQVKGWASRIGASMQGAISMAAGQMMAQGIGQITTAIQNLGRESINTASDYIKSVEEMARATGITSEEASRLIQVADDQRISVGELSTAITMYSRNQSAAGKSTNISIAELGRLSDEYLRLEPGTQRNAFLLEKFGRSGMSMARMMEQGSAALQEFSDEVDENLIITQEAIDTQRKYEEAMDDLDDALKGLKIELGRALLEVLPDFTKFLKETGIPALKLLVDLFVNMPRPVQNAIVGLGLFLGFVAKMAMPIMGIIGIIKMFLGPAAVGGVAPAASAASTGLTGMGTAGLVALAPIGLLIGAIGLLIWVWKNMGREATVAAEQLVFIVGYGFNRLGQIIKEAAIYALNDMTVFFFNLLIAASTSSTQLLEIFKFLFQQTIWFANAIVSAIEEAVEYIVADMKKLWNSIVSTAKGMAKSAADWFKTVGDSIVKGIWAGIQAGWQWLIDQVEALIDSLIDAAMAALEAASPSRKFILVGATIPQGIGVGMAEEMQQVKLDLQQLLGGLPGLGYNVSVNRMELHGSFSRDELRRFDRREKRIAGNAIADFLGA